MADTNRPDSREHGNPPEAGHRVNSDTPSWLDGLPHNFSGWGPRTPDAESDEIVQPSEDELKWNGEGDHRHYVWTFQRSRHHH